MVEDEDGNIAAGLFPRFEYHIEPIPKGDIVSNAPFEGDVVKFSLPQKYPLLVVDPTFMGDGFLFNLDI